MSRATDTLAACVRAVGLAGPGLRGWAEGSAILAGVAPYAGAPTDIPVPVMLSAAERRRAGRVLRLAIGVAHEAVGGVAADVATVFTSSGNDGDNCHELCSALASAAREVSPTRFMNSVHNAAAGYWSLAARSMRPATALCAYDGSFSAGLLEALTQIRALHEPVLLVAYDADYPEPLRAARPIPDAFATALLLTPPGDSGAFATLALRLTEEPATTLPDAPLEALSRAIPAARSLPLLALLARSGMDGGRNDCVLDYLDDLRVGVHVSA